MQTEPRVHVRRRTAVPIEVIVLASLPALAFIRLPLRPGLRILVLFLVCLWLADLWTRRLWLPNLSASADFPEAFVVGEARMITLNISQPALLELAVDKPVGVKCSLQPRLDDSFELAITPTRRELLDAIVVHGFRSSPLGLTATKDVFTIAVPDGVPVLPRPVSALKEEREILALLSRVEPELGGVRPYQAGDRPSSVHWLSSSRAGEILVRERVAADAGAGSITLAVRGHDPVAFEVALGKAFWLIERLKERGTQVELRVPGMPVADDPHGIARALAAAKVGELAPTTSTAPIPSTAPKPSTAVYWLGS